MAALAQPSKTFEIICDVSDPPAISAAVRQAAAHFGRLDALVNNAGIAIFKPILETTPEDWARVLAVNLTGPFLAAQAAAPIMAEGGGGAMVNITSISGLRASTLRVAYGTSKAGLAHLTKQQAVEFASLRIRVNAVAPGYVDTPLVAGRRTPESYAATAALHPLGRLGIFAADAVEGVWQRVWVADTDPFAVVDFNADHLAI
jgi:NAD(P)-dependent dehydrogenase (short-subunit alcohol dehydrogenase family)